MNIITIFKGMPCGLLQLKKDNQKEENDVNFTLNC